MKYFAGLLLLFFSFTANAGDFSQDALISRFFAGTQKISLDFRQIKAVPDIEKIFQSTGFFQFVKDKGFIIKQEKFPKFVSTTERFCFGDKNEELKKLPYFSDIKQLFDDLLVGNMENLNKIFDVAYSETKNLWQMTLTPTQKDMKNFISKIHLTGTIKQIKTLSIEYTDKTKINVNFSISDKDLINEIEC